jgi:hypothetical protein
MTLNGTGASRHRWTSAEELALIRLHNKGKTIGEIALVLGMRKPQVQHRIVALRSEGRIAEYERPTRAVKLDKFPKEEEPEGTPVHWERGTYYVSPGRIIHKSYVKEDQEEG